MKYIFQCRKITSQNNVVYILNPRATVRVQSPGTIQIAGQDLTSCTLWSETTAPDNMTHREEIKWPFQVPLHCKFLSKDWDLKNLKGWSSKAEEKVSKWRIFKCDAFIISHIMFYDSMKPFWRHHFLMAKIFICERFFSYIKASKILAYIYSCRLAPFKIYLYSQLLTPVDRFCTSS